MTGQPTRGTCSTLEQRPGDLAALGGERTDVGTGGPLALGRNLDPPQTSEQPPLRKMSKSLQITQVKEVFLSR